MNDDMQPCPFCGSTNIESGEALIKHNGTLSSQAGCNDCGAMGPRKPANMDDLAHRDDRSDNAWNIRA